MADGLSSQLVRPSRGLTGEARSRPGVTVAGGLRCLQGQRDESDDGRHSLGSCCPEDLSVACRPPSGELTHAPADPEPCTEDTAVNNYMCLGRRPGAPKWVPGWCRLGRGWRVPSVVDVPVISDKLLQSESYVNVEVPQIQFIVTVLDIPVASQRQAPTVFQVQFLEVVDMPVVVQRQVHAAAACRQGRFPGRGAEADPHGSVCFRRPRRFRSLQSIDKVVVPVVQIVQVFSGASRGEDRRLPQLQSLRKSLRSASSWTRSLTCPLCSTTVAWV